MIEHIPTTVIAGPLGAGKTRFIQDLLAQKPADERWAVLINEFGQIGLDAALLANQQAGISLTEVAGGCVCCVNGAPFEVALARLIRQSKPHRLLIEPSGLAHPKALMDKLSQAPWQGVLKVTAPIMLLDVHDLAPLNEAQQALLSTTQHLVLTKAEELTTQARHNLSARFADKHIHWRMLEPLPLNWLAAKADHPAVDKAPKVQAKAALNELWISPAKPLFASVEQDEGYALGWRFHPSQGFVLAKLEALFASLNYVRAKAVIHSEQGWLSCNMTQGQTLAWRHSEWRNDSRLEWIFSTPVDKNALEQALLACVKVGAE